MANPKQNEALRGIVSAVLCDLCAYMVKLEAPLVIGGEYSPMNALTIFENFCYDRDIKLDAPDKEIWEKMHSSGMLTTGEIKRPDKRLKFKNGK